MWIVLFQTVNYVLFVVALFEYFGQAVEGLLVGVLVDEGLD